MKKSKMFKMISSIAFHGNDQKLMTLINNYAQEVEGVSPTAAIRNLLLRILPQETARLKKDKKERREIS